MAKEGRGAMNIKRDIEAFEKNQSISLYLVRFEKLL